jgi:hypothetical protein
MSPEQIAALIEESQTVEPVYRSRVYGYQIERGKMPVIIPAEADVVRLAIRGLMEGRSLEEIASELRGKNVRSRSKRFFSPRSLASLVRPYYAGMEKNTSGVLCPVCPYPPIITVQEYLRAKRALECHGFV